MGKPYLLFGIIFLLFFQLKETRAHHMIGGEITWTCLPNGQYIFKMNLYKDCAGTSFYFNNQTINYQGGTITVKPDSNKWLSYGGNGNVSFKGPDGCQKSCTYPNIDLGAVQFLPFVSDPVSLNGVPPPGGWTFTYGPICCRGYEENLDNPASQSFTLRSVMYPYLSQSASNCYDSSPQFAELPNFVFCKAYDVIYNNNASDRDLDSLVFSWSSPWDMPNTPVSFSTGYTYDNPLPDSNIHSLNKPANIDSRTGEISFRTQSGINFDRYTTCVQVDSYRKGVKIASVFRDIPYTIIDCQNIPGTNSSNNPASVTFNGMSASGYTDTVYAGQKINVPFTSVESDIVYADPSDPTTASLQNNYVSPSGMLFSNDFVDSLSCQGPSLAPCATLTPAPVLNPLNGEMELSNQGTITTLFEWQTDCVHLGDSSSNYKRYNFVFKNYDEQCDLPALIYPTLSIVVARYLPTIKQNGNILYVDQAQSYQWYFNGNPIANSDTSAIIISALGKYSVEVVKYGCKSQRADYQVLNVSLEEKDWKKDLEIYPNPFEGVFYIQTGHLSGLKVQVSNVNGKLVYSKSYDEGQRSVKELNLEGQSKGVYFVKFQSRDFVDVRKIVLH